MKKILIPIDFDFNSYNAVDYVLDLFKKEQCEFYFLNTYTNTVDEFAALGLLKSSDTIFEIQKRDSEISLGRVIQKYATKSKNEKHRFNAISECTHLLEGIKKVIKNIKIDLVVLAGKEQSSNDGARYSKNTKNIIDTIRECPVMIVPASPYIKQQPKFVLVSSFEKELPYYELENWYELVEIAQGSVKIVTLSERGSLTPFQQANLKKVRFQIEMLSRRKPIKVEYIKTVSDLRNFANYHSDYIICLMDRKPNFLRKCGLTHSRITNLGPLISTPLIALHR